MEDKIFVTHDEENNITGAFGFEPEEPFITVPSSVWKQFAIHKKEDLTINDGKIKVSDSALALMETAKKVQEANTFLKATDWVEPLIIAHKMGVDGYVLSPDSNRLLIDAQRDEARAFDLGDAREDNFHFFASLFWNTRNTAQNFLYMQFQKQTQPFLHTIFGRKWGWGVCS